MEDEKVIEELTKQYEEKLEQQKKQLEAEKEKAIEELEAKHIKQLQAILSGRKEIEKTEDEEKDECDEIVENLRKKYKIIGE